MRAIHLRDQRGVAMVVEIVLVAAVLGLVGLAVYQASRHNAPQSAITTSASPAPSSANGVAQAAAAITEQESAADASASVAADNIAAEVVSADADVTNLGGASDVSTF